MAWRQRVAGLRIDVTPLRTSRDFRLLFAAGTVFYLGGMVSYVAVPYQIYQLTGSNFAVGALALVELLPLIVFGLYGGALADHVDRRRMLVLCGVAQVVLTSLLLVISILNPNYVRPLDLDMKQRLSPKNPFFEHAEASCSRRTATAGAWGARAHRSIASTSRATRTTAVSSGSSTPSTTRKWLGACWKRLPNGSVRAA